MRAVEFPGKPMFEKSMIAKKSEKRRPDPNFEAEARWQSLLIAAAARDPNSDEAAVMRELEAHWEELCREIEAEEAKNQCAI
jgi:16S rRNA C1402 (ribose-2'-O) methylase RsmI